VIIIERVLARREMQAKLEKLNMVVGAFFSEVGNHLLQDLIKHFDNREEISRKPSNSQTISKSRSTAEM
jgi:hypothetical protein